MSRFKLVFFVPVQDTRKVLNHIFSTNSKTVGNIGNYENCAFMMPGTGQFRPGSDAHPVIGKPGELEFVEENRVEVVVSDKGGNEEIKNVIKELKAVRRPMSFNWLMIPIMHQVHPYEEVAYDVYRLEDF